MSERFAFNPPSPSPSAAAGSGGRLRRCLRRRRPPSLGRIRRRSADAEPTDWAFTWTLVFTAVLFLRPQDMFPPLDVLHLAELSAMRGLVTLFMGRLAPAQAITRITPELAGVLGLRRRHSADRAVLDLDGRRDRHVPGPLPQGHPGLPAGGQRAHLAEAARAADVAAGPRVGYLAFRAVFDYARGVNLTPSGTRVRGRSAGSCRTPTTWR